MLIRLTDGHGGVIAEVETDHLPAENIWIERVSDGHTLGSLYFGDDMDEGVLVSLGQYDDGTQDWVERSRLVETEDEIMARVRQEED